MFQEMEDSNEGSQHGPSTSTTEADQRYSNKMYIVSFKQILFKVKTHSIQLEIEVDKQWACEPLQKGKFNTYWTKITNVIKIRQNNGSVKAIPLQTNVNLKVSLNPRSL